MTAASVAENRNVINIIATVGQETKVWQINIKCPVMQIEGGRFNVKAKGCCLEITK